MDVFPVINDVVAITHSEGLLTSAVTQLVVYFIVLPLVLIQPIGWVINYSLLSLRSFIAQKSFYLTVYEKHLPYSSGVNYKTPNYPVQYFGDIGPRSRLELCLLVFQPVVALLIVFKSALPWYKERLLGGKLPTDTHQLQGIKVSMYFFLPYVYLTFYQKERSHGDDAFWLTHKVRLAKTKETEVLFNQRYKIRLKWG